MRRRTAVAVSVALLLVASCTDASEPKTDETWAQEAEAVVALLADAYDIADPYQTARFFTAGGTLDLTVWGRGVAKTPDEVVEAVRQLWFMKPDHANVTANHLFVSPDSAVVWWSAFDKDYRGGSTWVQSYTFGKRGQTASQAFRNVEGNEEHDTPEEQAALQLADRYFEAWEIRDPQALAAIYSPTVVVRDDTRGREWRSLEELLAGLSDAEPVQPGPHPRTFIYQEGSEVQVIALVQRGGACPMLEARRWVLAGDLIVSERRYTHVPSAQRCLTDLPDGWWTTFELPPGMQDNVTEIVDVGGLSVELVNAEPIHEEFSRWLFDRFIEAGIGIPEVAAVWFPPVPECDELGGLAIEADERYAGRHTVVLCFTDERLSWDAAESGWYPVAANYGLHELAHIWMVDHLTDATRDEFNERAGLAGWRQGDIRWADRGVEQAAFTIPWAITGNADALWPFHFPDTTCEELAARYALLTDHEPLTTCGENGWSR